MILGIMFVSLFSIVIFFKDRHKSVYEEAYNHFSNHHTLMSLIIDTSISLEQLNLYPNHS
jgi:hypothetical protein